MCGHKCSNSDDQSAKEFCLCVFWCSIKIYCFRKLIVENSSYEFSLFFSSFSIVRSLPWNLDSLFWQCQAVVIRFVFGWWWSTIPDERVSGLSLVIALSRLFVSSEQDEQWNVFWWNDLLVSDWLNRAINSVLFHFYLFHPHYTFSFHYPPFEHISGSAFTKRLRRRVLTGHNI